MSSTCTYLSCLYYAGPDIEYRILPWRADQTAINIWLMQQGYGNCVDKIAGMVKEGSQLYAMDRETLREILGSSDGVRLYSQLQKDKSKSEKEAGIVKETELQVDELIGILTHPLV